MIWYYVSLLLCFFGFLKEIRPSEPFVSDYMHEPYRNVTKEEVNSNGIPKFQGNSSILLIFIHKYSKLIR